MTDNAALDYSPALRITIALLLSLAGTFFMFAQPAIVGVYAETMAFSLGEISRIVSFQAAGQLVAIFGISFILKRLDVRKITLTAGVLLIAVELVSTQVDSSSWLMPVRFLAGLLAGTCLAIGTAVISGMSNAGRVFAGAALLQAVGGVAVLSNLAFFVNVSGVAGFYLSIAAIVVLSLICVRHLPLECSDPNAVNSSDDSVSASTASNKWLPLLVLAGLTFFYASVSALWPYVERIGSATGLSPEELGGAFGTMGLISIGLSIFVVYLGSKAGNFIPILTGLACMLAACVIYATDMDYNSYLVGVGLQGGSVILASPYFLALLAIIDRSGKLGVIGMGCIYTTQVLGPQLAPWLVDGDNFDGLLLATGCFVIGCIAIMCYLLKFKAQLNEESEPAGVTAAS